jgi:hypothetical protein
MVNTLGSGDEDKVEGSSEQPGASELEDILVRNGSGVVSFEEWRRAAYLISILENGSSDCIICRSITPSFVDKAIEGLDYCRGHASYVLITQK